MNLNVLVLKNCPILDQLLLEEYLLRDTVENWCILNEGSKKAIVMGISGNPHDLIDIPKACLAKVPVIKRFSGGGTVVVDENTLFVTFICNSKEFGFAPFPEKIHKWAEGIYKGVFADKSFAFRENDYVFEDKKFGGNAQYIKKNRWLHHTSFLWDYDPKNMDLLLMPKKTPPYRLGRGHEDFLCKLKEFEPSKDAFFEKLTNHLKSLYTVESSSLEKISPYSASRTSTQLISL